MSKAEPFTIAAVQARSEFLDLEASVQKACRLIKEAGEQGAVLAVFPEAFLPAYPVWAWFIPAGHVHPLRALYSELHANSVSIPGEQTDRLCRAVFAVPKLSQVAQLIQSAPQGVFEVGSEILTRPQRLALILRPL